MSEPKDDDGHLDVVLTESSCPHCVIVEMMRSLIEDRTLTAKEAADYAYSALVDVVAMLPPHGRLVFTASAQIALPGAVERAAATNRPPQEPAAPAGCTKH